MIPADMRWSDLFAWWRPTGSYTDEIWRARAELGLEGDAGGPEGAIGWIDGIEISMCVGTAPLLGDRMVELRGPQSEQDTRFAVGAAEPLGPGEPGSTGDPLFDAVVAAHPCPGHPGALRWLALADPATRSLLTQAVRAGASWTGRRWVIRFEPPARPTAAQLVAAARTVARVHPRWSWAWQREVRAAILERVKDPVPGVRRRAIKVAMEHGWTGQADLASALTDYDPGVRLAVAMALDKWDVVLDLARTGTRTWRVRAAMVLARRSPRPEIREELEQVLIAALPDPELAEVAALALADVGSALALGPLLTATPPEARSAARVAAQRIRHRSPPAGSLALAQGQDGALSLSGEPGALSESKGR
jgi:hypothetical protein